MATKKAAKKPAAKKKPRRVTLTNPCTPRREEMIVISGETPEDVAAQINAIRSEQAARTARNKLLWASLETNLTLHYDGKRFFMIGERFEREMRARRRRRS